MNLLKKEDVLLVVTLIGVPIYILLRPLRDRRGPYFSVSRGEPDLEIEDHTQKDTSYMDKEEKYPYNYTIKYANPSPWGAWWSRG